MTGAGVLRLVRAVVGARRGRVVEANADGTEVEASLIVGGQAVEVTVRRSAGGSVSRWIVAAEGCGNRAAADEPDSVCVAVGELLDALEGRGPAGDEG